MEKFELIVRQFFYLSICNSSHKVNVSLVLFIYLFLSSKRMAFRIFSFSMNICTILCNESWKFAWFFWKKFFLLFLVSYKHLNLGIFILNNACLQISTPVLCHILVLILVNGKIMLYTALVNYICQKPLPTYFWDNFFFLKKIHILKNIKNIIFSKLLPEIVQGERNN